MLINCNEVFINTDYAEKFEREYSQFGMWVEVFFRHGCEGWSLYRDRRDPEHYIYFNTWPDKRTFIRAQENAAQEAYEWGQFTRNWIKSQRELDNAEAASIQENAENQFELLSSV